MGLHNAQLISDSPGSPIRTRPPSPPGEFLPESTSERGMSPAFHNKRGHKVGLEIIPCSCAEVGPGEGLPFPAWSGLQAQGVLPLAAGSEERWQEGGPRLQRSPSRPQSGLGPKRAGPGSGTARPCPGELSDGLGQGQGRWNAETVHRVMRSPRWDETKQLVGDSDINLSNVLCCA